MNYYGDLFDLFEFYNYLVRVKLVSYYNDTEPLNLKTEPI